MALVSLMAAVGALAATPAPAGAVALCTPIPVSTPPITVVGRRIPALGNFELCVDANAPVNVNVPQVITGCGDPCIGIVVKISPVTASVWGGTITLSYTEDGVPQSTSIPIPSLGPTWDGSTICVLSIGDAC